MSYGNTKFKLSPIEALKYLNNLCYDEYNKGKRKININKVWNIVDAGLSENYTGGTTTPVQSVFSNNRSDDSTATKFPNSGPGGVIG
jgi:hypothetical protein